MLHTISKSASAFPRVASSSEVQLGRFDVLLSENVNKQRPVWSEGTLTISQHKAVLYAEGGVGGCSKVISRFGSAGGARQVCCIRQKPLNDATYPPVTCLFDRMLRGEITEGSEFALSATVAVQVQKVRDLPATAVIIPQESCGSKRHREELSDTLDVRTSCTNRRAALHGNVSLPPRLDAAIEQSAISVQNSPGAGSDRFQESKSFGSAFLELRNRILNRVPDARTSSGAMRPSTVVHPSAHALQQEGMARDTSCPVRLEDSKSLPTSAPAVSRLPMSVPLPDAGLCISQPSANAPILAPFEACAVPSWGFLPSGSHVATFFSLSGDESSLG